MNFGGFYFFEFNREKFFLNFQHDAISDNTQIFSVSFKKLITEIAS